MKRAIIFLIVTLPCFTTLGQEEKIELYKKNGKPILFEANEGFVIVLNDSINDSDSTTTSIIYSGNLILKDQKFLYFKPTFLDSSTKHFERNHWSTVRNYNSPEFPEQKAINLDRIKYLKKETNVGQIFAGIAAFGLIHTLITAPAASVRFYNWNPSFDGDFYFRQMAISLPITVISFTCYYSFRERTFKVKKE